MHYVSYSPLDPNPPPLPKGADPAEIVLGDTIYSVENFLGTERNDRLVYGSDISINGTMRGLGGDDFLAGGKGARLDGGLGADRYEVREGAVILEDAGDGAPTVIDIVGGNFSIC